MIGVYFFTALVLADVICHIDASGWGYDDIEKWPALCHEGKKQSPIALSNGISTPIEHPHIVFMRYDSNLEMTIKNNGHSAEVRPIEGQVKPQIRSGGLPRVYELDHFHFHWPSEHVMENIKFPLELHMVHYAVDYGNVTAALEHPQGVAVLGVLFHMSQDDDDHFEPLLEIIETIQDRVNEGIKMENIVPMEFLPRDLSGFYRYDGSLTTPACTEGIVWTVLSATIPISRKQVAIFQKLHTDHHTVLKRNFRPLQSLNDRTLYQRVNPPPGKLMTINGNSQVRSWPYVSVLLIFFFIFWDSLVTILSTRF